MFDFFEKGFFATIGVLSLTREKTQEFVDDLVKRGELNKDEGKQLVDRLIAKGQEERENLRKVVRQEVNTAFTELNLPTREDIQTLNDKLNQLLADKEKA